MTRIGIDFDGTLAVWPRGTKPNYNDPQLALTQSACIPAALRWLQIMTAQGHQFTVITGRNANQAPQISRWLQIFLGERFPVHGRPANIGLSCREQAAWKATVIQELRLEVYVGDNLQIDRVAAEQANVPFIDANCFLCGELPDLQSQKSF